MTSSASPRLRPDRRCRRRRPARRSAASAWRSSLCATLSRVSAGVSTHAQMGVRDRRSPRPGGSPGCRPAAKLAWSELVISGRTVRSGLAVGRGDAAAGTARRRHSRCSARPGCGLPATELRLTLSAIFAALRSAQALHVLRRAGERPFLDAEEHDAQPAPAPCDLRRQRARHGQHRRRARCRCPWRSRRGRGRRHGRDSTTHSSVVPGYIVNQRLGFGRPPPRSRSSWSPVGQPSGRRASRAAVSGAMPSAGMPLATVAAR